MKLRRGLCRRLFGDVRFPDLTPEQVREYQRMWKVENADRVKAALDLSRDKRNRLRRERILNDPVFRAKLRAREVEYRRTHPQRTAEAYRKYRLKAEYGLTPEDYNIMLERQGSLCALCGATPLSVHHRKLVVDHDHVTGRVRGLLCHNCNLVLGHLGDDVNLMKRAIAYLQRAERSQKDSVSFGPLFQEKLAV
jgi:hypothetical protein